MIKGRLMIAIVNKGDASLVMGVARDAGARGGTIINARGTATSSILAALGLGDTKKEILLSFIGEEEEEKVREEVNKVKAKGILVFLSKEEDEDLSNFQMIQVISEAGYADDIMASARKAGARGGSVIAAHGTAKPDDTKFFGYPIVSEKEILIIVAEREKAKEIVEEIESMEALNQKGKAVIFTLPVSSFKNLG